MIKHLRTTSNFFFFFVFPLPRKLNRLTVTAKTTSPFGGVLNYMSCGFPFTAGLTLAVLSRATFYHK